MLEVSFLTCNLGAFAFHMFTLWEQCEKSKLESKTILSPKAGMAVFCRHPNNSPVQKADLKSVLTTRRQMSPIFLIFFFELAFASFNARGTHHNPNKD